MKNFIFLFFLMFFASSRMPLHSQTAAEMVGIYYGKGKTELILNPDSSFYYIEHGCFWSTKIVGKWIMKKDTIMDGNQKCPIDYIEVDKDLIISKRVWIENINEIKILRYKSEECLWVTTMRRKE